MNKFNKSVLKFFSSVIIFSIIITNIPKVYGLSSDASGSAVSGGGGGGGTWQNTISGIRMAVVDQNGNLVSNNTKDFMHPWQYLPNWLDWVYVYRCNNKNNTKLYYINGNKCSWKYEQGGINYVSSKYIPINFTVDILDNISIDILSDIIGIIPNSISTVSPEFICLKLTLFPSMLDICVFDCSISSFKLKLLFSISILPFK